MKTFIASCHCKGARFGISLDPEQLPLPAKLCHCSVCRQTHGAPCSFHALLPPGVEPVFISPSSEEKLSRYAHEKSTSTRFFCSTCGCHIGDRSHEGATWVISVSLFEEGTKPAWVFQSQVHSDPLADSAFAPLLPGIPVSDGSPIKDPLPPTADPETLLAECHCGGVSFRIARPSMGFRSDQANAGWWHRSDPTKWLALVDVCTDCRLVTGTHTIGWMFVPRSHTHPPVPPDLLIGTSKRYSSSPGITRTFCGTCGATIFYTCESRPEIVDVATGILRAPEGTMAAHWAIWRTVRMGYPQDGLNYDTTFTEDLQDGLQKWGRRRDGAVRDFVVGSEASHLQSE